MKTTQLIEFKKSNKNILRGILVFDSEAQNDRLAIMMGGFERTATTEVKFKVLADELIKKGIASFRFDYTGVGLSDGDFRELSIKNLKVDLLEAVKAITKDKDYKEKYFISHSIASCLLADNEVRNIFKKNAMICPALNQRKLLRLWHTIINTKSKISGLKITWKNFKKYLDEEAFINYCNDNNKMTKGHYLGSRYFLENEDKDYSLDIEDSSDILLVHGEKDDKVPFASLNTNYKNKIIVSDGDHDLERPDMRENWMDKTIDFLNK